jgi:hypothetical protein
MAFKYAAKRITRTDRKSGDLTTAALIKSNRIYEKSKGVLAGSGDGETEKTETVVSFGRGCDHEEVGCR